MPSRAGRFAAIVAFAAAILVSFPWTAHAADAPSRFKDPEDGAFDVSGWLATKTGFLPVLTPITEPAVGYGAALGLLFFHGGGLANTVKAPPGPTGRPISPDVSLAGAALTENGTWGAFAGHLGFWGGDRWRYMGGLARYSMNLDYYGSGDRAFGFNMDGWALYQELTRRVGRTDLFVGARFVYLDSDISFDFDALPPDIPRPSFASTDWGLGFVAEYDTRDNNFTPSRGVDVKAAAMFRQSSLGDDGAFQIYTVTPKLYWDVKPRLVLAARLQVQTVSGDAPFYALPSVNLRGIPAMRYQGAGEASVDGEVRWNAFKRWWLVAFAGAGWTGDDLGSLQAGDNVHAGGLGFRYLVARALGLQMGLDVAKGPEQYAIYVVTGSSF
jgi:hypothetical protein